MDEKESHPTGGSTEKPADECLHSWKEIAAHLKCSERTVRRWEKAEGLPVHRHPHKKRATIYAFRAELDSWWNDGHSRLEQQEQAQPGARRRGIPWLVWIVLALIAGSACWLFLSRNAPRATLPPLRVIPLTSYAGLEYEPALSPDGTRVAFLWTGETGSMFPDLYVKTIDAPKPVRLTNTPDGYEAFPAWSPDGCNIAYTRNDKSGVSAIFTISALGGTERKLVDLTHVGTGLDWSPDGRYLAFSDKDSPGNPTSIFLLALDSMKKRRMTSPRADLRGDSRPAFSPDSSALAFVRTGASSVSIFISAIAGGEPKHLLTQRVGSIPGVAWTENGHDLVYSAPVAQEANNYSLWQIPAAGGVQERLTSDLENSYSPTISRRGHRLAYAHQSVDINIWRLEVTENGIRANPPALLIHSTRQDGAPQYSPDGKKIAFQSDRLGSREIWICDSDGSHPVQLTFSNGATASAPRWSPDGLQIAFKMVGSGSDRQTGVYVVAAEGGTPRCLVAGDYEAVGAPSWSRDGKWVYFGSDRTGRAEVWRVPSAGGSSLQLTRNGGSVLFESPDGKSLYYNKPDSAGLWKISAAGGAESRILDYPDPAYWGSWTMVKDGIYFVNDSPRPHGAIEFYSFATRQVNRIMMFDREPDTWDVALAVSPDGRSILFSQIDSDKGDLVLIENFR